MTDGLKRVKEEVKITMYDRHMLAAKVSEGFEYHKWVKEIPFLNFPEEWIVKPMPPFGGAIVRFAIKHKDNSDTHVSVYLDCYEMLGVFSGPYWEVFPYDDDIIRVAVGDIEGLMQSIRESLNQQIEEGGRKRG